MKNIFFAIVYVLYIDAYTQNIRITNIPGRKTFSLHGKWNAIVDPYETGFYDYRLQPFDEYAKTDPAYAGFFVDAKATDKTQRIEYDFDKSETLIVPGTWNTQQEKLFLYEGTVWYRKKFSYNKEQADNRLFIYFGAANYEAHVYVNKKKAGMHIGGFTPFCFEITDMMLPGENTVVVKIDNKRKREGVPTVNTDWFNYGGITRDVYIVETAPIFIRDYFIQLKQGTKNIISGYVQIDGVTGPHKISLHIPELSIQKEFTTNNDGYAAVELAIKNAVLWSPQNPKLYTVIIRSAEDEISEKIGFRSIEVKGTEILLNGNPVFLRGICIHEENPLRGTRAHTAEDARMLLGWAKELSCNFVRLAHYPHNDYMARIADEMGIMVWAENPVYWTIAWENKNTLENARNQLSELISRDKNRASIIIWSMANETPKNDARLAFLVSLTQTARALDNTRLISAAMEKHADPANPLFQMVEDDYASYADVVSFNQYIGWYDGLPDKCSKVRWHIPYDKPVIISEFGGSALAGFYGDSLTRWTEDYQEYLFRETLTMIDKIPQLRGVTPWLLADFRSPRRLLPGIQDGWNRKGVYGQNGEKKKAFYVLKKYYVEKEKIWK